MLLGGLDISSRPTIDWYRWFSLNRSSRNVSLTYHPLYLKFGVPNLPPKLKRRFFVSDRSGWSFSS